MSLMKLFFLYYKNILLYPVLHIKMRSLEYDYLQVKFVCIGQQMGSSEVPYLLLLFALST